MTTEIHEGRFYVDLGCHFCGQPPVYTVTELKSGEDMVVCEIHKFTAFS